jgi:hypothetical protein
MRMNPSYTLRQRNNSSNAARLQRPTTVHRLHVRAEFAYAMYIVVCQHSKDRLFVLKAMTHIDHYILQETEYHMYPCTCQDFE